MTSISEIRSWMFKGMAAESRLDALEAAGTSVRDARDPRALQRVMPLEDFSPAVRRSSMRALEAYLAFFCLENSIRELIDQRLGENHGPNWSSDSSIVSTSIQNRVDQRRQKEGKDRWHTIRGEADIYYTDFGDLRLIIQRNWADFEDLLPDQNWMIARLDELEKSRNVIAHSNVLDERELQRLRMNVKDWLRQVG